MNSEKKETILALLHILTNAVSNSDISLDQEAERTALIQQILLIEELVEQLQCLG